MSNKITIKIEGKSIKTEKKLNLIDVAKDNGFEIPTLLLFQRITSIGYLPGMYGKHKWQKHNCLYGKSFGRNGHQRQYTGTCRKLVSHY